MDDLSRLSPVTDPKDRNAPVVLQGAGPEALLAVSREVTRELDPPGSVRARLELDSLERNGHLGDPSSIEIVSRGLPNAVPFIIRRLAVVRHATVVLHPLDIGPKVVARLIVIEGVDHEGDGIRSAAAGKAVPLAVSELNQLGIGVVDQPADIKIPVVIEDLGYRLIGRRFSVVGNELDEVGGFRSPSPGLLVQPSIDNDLDLRP